MWRWKEKAQTNIEKACLQNEESQPRMAYEIKMAKVEKVKEKYLSTRQEKTEVFLPNFEQV